MHRSLGLLPARLAWLPMPRASAAVLDADAGGFTIENAREAKVDATPAAPVVDTLMAAQLDALATRIAGNVAVLGH